jgi:hypothetical protein
MEGHRMQLGPWVEVLANANAKIAQGWVVYQQWRCQHCGAKQTMPDENAFYLFGDCEECGQRTDIKSAGHNFQGVMKIRFPPGSDKP